jgi:hypothetical protein
MNLIGYQCLFGERISFLFNLIFPIHSSEGHVISQMFYNMTQLVQQDEPEVIKPIVSAGHNDSRSPISSKKSCTVQIGFFVLWEVEKHDSILCQKLFRPQWAFIKNALSINSRSNFSGTVSRVANDMA